MRILSMRYTIHILESEMLNHNVKRFRTDKPDGFAFEPGQATELSLPREKDLADDKHPFTFTSLPEDSWLEFTIKIYPEHEGLTDRLRKYGKGDVFEIGDAWGAITYKGPGLFLAGGAGVTPFLAILRKLDEQGELDGNALWFSNKKSEDIFLADELRARLGDNPKNRHDRKPKWTEKNDKGRWRSYDYEELIKRDKINLDIFWLKDEALEESANLPPPEAIAAEIVEDLEAALEQFAEIANDLKK